MCIILQFHKDRHFLTNRDAKGSSRFANAAFIVANDVRSVGAGVTACRTCNKQDDLSWATLVDSPGYSISSISLNKHYMKNNLVIM